MERRRTQPGHPERVVGRLVFVAPGLADVELSGDRTVVLSRIEFLDAETYREEGSIDFGHGDRVDYRSRERGLLVNEPRGVRRGTSTLEVCGGTGRYAEATGRIVSSFVVTDDGEIVDDLVVDIVINGEERE